MHHNKAQRSQTSNASWPLSKTYPRALRQRDHRKVEVGTLEDLLQQGHLEPIVQDRVQVSLEYPKG